MESLAAYPFTKAVLEGSERWALVDEDCLEFLARLPDNSIDAVVTDPPAAISFMGRDWDVFEDRKAFVGFLAERFAQCLRVLKPGGHALVWALPRTSHWTAWAIEEAGFEIRDCIYHVFATGFAKGGTVDKTIHRKSPERVEEWTGWGTTLKPATECWWLVRKPFKGAVADNILEHGTGALNIDGCRISTDETLTRKLGKTTVSPSGWTSTKRSPIAGKDGGRWPANLILSHSPDCVGEASTTQSNTIRTTTGNLLQADVEALVNAVNTVGVMGGGIALQFKQTFPENFYAYAKACAAGEVVPGRMFIYETGTDSNPKYIINFPTKQHWRSESTLDDIQIGLSALITDIVKLNIRSIAVPALGCGLGGLNWHDVRPMIEHAFEQLKDVDVTLYVPLEYVDAKRGCVPDCPVAELDRQSGLSKSSKGKPRKSKTPGDGWGMTKTGAEYNDQGGASRFFYIAKPSRKEKEAGLDKLPDRSKNAVYGAGLNSATKVRTELQELNGVDRGGAKNNHPTVKAIQLMRYLCRLVTPPGGVILDPFTGSGSTGCGAVLEGFRFIGVEQDPAFVELAAARILYWQKRADEMTVQADSQT
jgi:DNA modification methylase/O-acetyl-ADP-ribose deacetylase (regulator of RNase III)